MTFSILYTPVIIHAIDELEGSLEILDIDPLITSLVGFVGFIEYALCIGVAARMIMRDETTTTTNVDINNFCLNNVSLYIKKEIEDILYND
ncbi:MAG: hypothetical protein ACXWE6_06330 [Nitrososphaeraceae archaeon]